jgi:hypothetical protein
MDLVNQLHNLLDSNTSRDPEWWFLARNVEEIWDLLELDIAALNKHYKRKYRSLRRSSIRDAVFKQKERLNTGRMRMALASFLGKHKQSFLYDTLHCADGSYEADPVEIHRQIQTHYRKHFSADSKSLIQRLNLDLPELGSAARWEVFMDDPESMTEVFLNPPDDLRPTAVPA